MNTRNLQIAGIVILAAFLLVPDLRRLLVSGVDKIRSLIAGEEGLRLEPYQDQKGKWTIGYGHLIKPTDPYWPVGPIKKITKAEADALFTSDIAESERCVKTSVKVPLTENQYSALVSFVFNVGCPNFQTSTMLKYINAKQYVQAAAEMDKWVHSDGERLPVLVARRLREKQLFMTA